MPDSTPITKLYSSGPVHMPTSAYICTLRTMPTSKHSNSGGVPVSFITSRYAATFAGGLSKIIGGHAQRPSERVFR